MDAAWWALVDVSAFLLREGANKDLTDCEGKRAVDYAEAKLEKNLNAETNDRCREILKLLSVPSQRRGWRFWK